MQAGRYRKTSILETVLEIYFFVALLSTTGLDNLVCLTILLFGTIAAVRVGGVVLNSASALIAEVAASFS